MIVRTCFGTVVLLAMATAAQADLTISKKATHDVSCSAGVCTAMAKNANLNVTDLTNMLAPGDTTVKFGGGALAIQVQDGFSWTSTSRLTLDANTSVGFHKPVTVAGQGAVTITYNDGGTAGDLKFFDKGKVDFWNTSSSLIINGHSYTLVKDVQGIAQNAGVGQHAALVNNYDAAKDGTYTNSPVFYGLNGTLEGLGHSINNLTILSTDGGRNPIALYSDIADTGVLRNLALANANISTDPDYPANAIGSFAGRNFGLISGVYVSGQVSGASTIGGIAGVNAGNIVGSHASNQVTEWPGYGSVGGLVGYQDGGINAFSTTGVIDHSYATGTVIGSAGDTGGLIGQNVGLINASHFTGSVSGSGPIGGLAGLNSGTIQVSYTAGPVSGLHAQCVGGLVGWNLVVKWDYRGYDLPVVKDSYSTGSASGDDDTTCAGGSIGAVTSLHREYSTVKQVYSIGHVSGSVVGGFIGVAHHDHADWIKNDYWDIDTSGSQRAIGNKKAKPGITGLTDEQLKSGLPGGFDPKIWGQSPNINSGYPYLLANPPPK